MGLLEMIKEVWGRNKNERQFRDPLKCPNCGAKVDPNKDRCMACGVRLTSMFKLICPECKSENEFTAARCVKCKFDFGAASTQKTIYRCPICNYEADYYMLVCPACNTRFV
ncbi:hypothetical protein AUJ13_05365 [Candidatus Micrarchaeota archaeon CG1_02_49_24]|nr:MAG: hypothetical protein AUJ13_05365 [Candidatus Micrarchaeota archaeon CG1_02_49_24]HII53715.1 hypothetical protein [Candidatus Micrarchaeota archaeon]